MKIGEIDLSQINIISEDESVHVRKTTLDLEKFLEQKVMQTQKQKPTETSQF